MKSPKGISGALLEILYTGILRIRASGWEGDARQCAIEADHIHNLPELLANYSAERLSYYWEVEKPSYQDQCATAGADSVKVFEPSWECLQEDIEKATQPV